ncbi:hypothetical protein NHX12_012238 [Muraenolepis orangiensis]|uniref:Cadherin domain-containing protein n=1 Tax=Muraenolepis orangiensis TaxID=630683 RepID=A0A9Q0DF24_9TELE|nr:hypothetical protein NHX12_012238 [Muraenolepis orangiensis]
MDTIPSAVLLGLLFLGTINCSSSDILQRQKRNWIIDTFTIEEEDSRYPYVLGKIELDNEFTVLKLSGQGVDQDPKNILEINQTSGEINVLGKVHFEAYDTVKNKVDTRLSVEVQILDINDHAPTFSQSYYEVNLRESNSQGAYVIVVYAHDGDAGDNGTFDLKIISIMPEPSGLEFYMNPTGEHGNISFRGCLDYEKAKTYTILVEAKDHGEKVQLSSTCTVVVNIKDENNQLPVLTWQTPAFTVKEREVDVVVSRLRAVDGDTKGTDAWKATYTIHGEKRDHFRIQTDPETNEGVLYLTKPLDYEDQSALNVTVTVENEAAYFTCAVVSRVVDHHGLWTVVETKDKRPPLSERTVTVYVEDVNDPPIFEPVSKPARVYEDVPLGHRLETMTAFDRDMSHGNIVRYTVTVFAVDNGEPPLTGTGTLVIHLRDRNDNVPQLVTDRLDMCLSDGPIPSQTTLKAIDLDIAPFAGPFRYELHGDVKNKWRIEPQYGDTVQLIGESTVYAGHHKLLLEVFDQQDLSAMFNLSVQVCECKASGMVAADSCHSRKASSSVRLGSAAITILFLAIPLLLVILLLAFLLSCKREIHSMPDEGTEQHLIPSNTESPGSDCKKINILQATGEELGDYTPYLFADEGDPDSSPLLDPIPIEEVPFHPDMLLDFGPKFNNLATLCSPHGPHSTSL